MAVIMSFFSVIYGMLYIQSHSYITCSDSTYVAHRLRFFCPGGSINQLFNKQDEKRALRLSSK